MLNKIKKVLSSVALIKQIAVGLVIGILIAVFTPTVIPVVKIFGDLFVKALKGVAPVLVFFLVMNAMAQKKEGTNANMKPIIILYVIGTFCASLVGVALSFFFPTVLHLQVAADAKLAPPSGIIEVLHNVILSVVDNPVNALLTANYIGILAWAIIAGLALKSYANGTTKSVLDDIARAITQVVTWVIHFAPLGIMGLVADSVGTAGVDALLGYAKLLAVLIGAYILVALVMNPIIVFLNVHHNPYPLVWTTIRESGVYAFFTRSSAANIPVNLTLCKRLGLNPDTFTISIPLGATINMDGTSIMQGVAVIFIAEAYGIHLTPANLATVVVTATLASIGTAGIPSVGLVTLAMVLNSVGLPTEGIALIMGIDRILDMLRTAVNITGDAVCTTIVSHQEKALNREVFNRD